MSFIFPDTLGDLSNLSLRCYLTVTNELSAPETVTKICHPKLYSVEIRSNVQAATIFVDDNEVTLPAMLEAPRNSGFEVNPDRDPSYREVAN